ncbi:MAG: UbiA family prenyltransferase [Bacteroidetes bacterium]|nr:UbiA family prenyltransferase [Bacteroidota bacterium]
MRLVNNIISALLYTSIYAACCAVGLCMATERLINGHVPSAISWLHILVFASTLAVYNAHYLVKRSAPDVSERYNWSQNYMFLHYSIFAIGLAGILISLYFLPVKIFICCAILGILSFAYSLPLLPFEKKRLKDFGWIKIWILTMVWSIVTSVLPMLYWNKALSAFPYEILIRFVFLFALCVAFDIRDMQTDLDAKIFTLPNVIGVANSYKLIDISAVSFAVLSIVQYLRYPSLVRLIGELITAIAILLVARYTKSHSTDKTYLGLVDGVMLLYAVLVLLH